MIATEIGERTDSRTELLSRNVQVTWGRDSEGRTSHSPLGQWVSVTV